MASTILGPTLPAVSFTTGNKNKLSEVGRAGCGAGHPGLVAVQAIHRLFRMSCSHRHALLRRHAQVRAILEEQGRLPFDVVAADIDLPELQVVGQGGSRPWIQGEPIEKGPAPSGGACAHADRGLNRELGLACRCRSRPRAPLPDHPPAGGARRHRQRKVPTRSRSRARTRCGWRGSLPPATCWAGPQGLACAAALVADLRREAAGPACIPPHVACAVGSRRRACIHPLAHTCNIRRPPRLVSVPRLPCPQCLWRTPACALRHTRVCQGPTANGSCPRLAWTD